MKKYFIEISAEERKLLTEFVQQKQKDERRRIYARILLASGGGKTDREIANELDIKKATVATARKRFATEGIRFALDNPANMKITPTEWAKVIVVLVGLAFCIPAIVLGPMELVVSFLWASINIHKDTNFLLAILWTAYFVIFVSAFYVWVKWKSRPKKQPESKPGLAPIVGETFSESRGFPPPPESSIEVMGFPPPPESTAEVTGFPPPPDPAQNIAENDD